MDINICAVLTSELGQGSLHISGVLLPVRFRKKTGRSPQALTKKKVIL